MTTEQETATAREHAAGEQAKAGSPSRWKPILFALALAMALAGLFLAGYLPRQKRTAGLNAEAKEERESLPIVSVVQVKRSPAASELLLPGNIEPITEASILARAEGYLRRRYVDIGDRVKAGQLLAELDAPELEQQVSQARANVSQTKAALAQVEAGLTQIQANLKLAEVTAERWNTLVSRGVFSKQEGDEKRTVLEARRADVQAQQANVNAARENVRASEANLERLLELQGYTKVKAPFTGVVTARSVDVGALISNGGNRELFRMAQTGQLRIRIAVPQANAPSVRVGETAELLVQEFPRRKFIGHITRTANSLDQNTRTLPVEVQLANPENALLPGMYAQVRLVMARVEPPLLIPGDALVVRSDGPQVAIVQPGQKAHYQKVEVGRDYGPETEIVSGLKGGEMVIVNPTDDVREGARVEPTSGAKAKPQTGAAGAPKPAGTQKGSGQ